MGGDDRILLPWLCLSGWSRSAPRLGASEFPFAGSEVASSPEDAIGSSSHRRVIIVVKFFAEINMDL